MGGCGCFRRDGLKAAAAFWFEKGRGGREDVGCRRILGCYRARFRNKGGVVGRSRWTGWFTLGVQCSNNMMGFRLDIALGGKVFNLYMNGGD